VLRGYGVPVPKRELTRLIIHVDGAARNNPGPAAFGYVVRDDRGREIEAYGEFIGEATNNVAEYRGMIAAARRAVELRTSAAEFCVDSELLARQVAGKYRVKARHLKPLFAQLVAALNKIPQWRVRHVPRESNRAADRMANRALDARGVVT